MCNVLPCTCIQLPALQQWYKMQRNICHYYLLLFWRNYRWSQNDLKQKMVQRKTESEKYKRRICGGMKGRVLLQVILTLCRYLSTPCKNKVTRLSYTVWQPYSINSGTSLLDHHSDSFEVPVLLLTKVSVWNSVITTKLQHRCKIKKLADRE